MSNKLSVKERHISFAAQLKNLRTGREKIDLKKNKPRYRCACINITVFSLGADNRARTCTVSQRILSPSCLPVPTYPHRICFIILSFVDFVNIFSFGAEGGKRAAKHCGEKIFSYRMKENSGRSGKKIDESERGCKRRTT